MRISRYIMMLILVTFLHFSITYSQIKYNDEIKKSTMTTKEAMEYYLEELKKDPTMGSKNKRRVYGTG